MFIPSVMKTAGSEIEMGATIALTAYRCCKPIVFLGNVSRLKSKE
jgi:hypothetical protein